jgi:sortase A
MMRRKMILFAALVLACFGAWQSAQGAYIYAKAQLAQYLMRKSWDKTLAGATQVKPWPWADTWPVARLRAPRLRVERFVLAGASGEAMAFGPAHLEGTAAPGRAGNSVLSGHRDTHFKFLQHLQIGDALVVETARGVRRRYVVDSTVVVSKDDTRVVAITDDTRLTLVTCYPFNAIVPGGPLRYVVIAHAAAELAPAKVGRDSIGGFVASLP